MGIGALSHVLIIAPYREMIDDRTAVDPHRGATIGVVAGVTCAACLAAKRYGIASTVGAAVGAGIAGQVVGLLAGMVVMLTLTGLSESTNAYRWYVGTPTHFGQTFSTLCIVVPMVQTLCGIAAAGGGGFAAYDALRDTTARQTSNV